jgi:uncharacterized protein YdaU (DUF1376 family)
MRAAWWWIDRWRQSTAYTDMTAEEQGLYRNLLDEVWLREDCVIPDDPRILARVSGDPEAWERCGEKVLAWMKKVPSGWTHVTALEVIGQSIRRAANQKRYRDKHHNATDNAPDNAGDNGKHNKPDSPSPSLSNVRTYERKAPGPANPLIQRVPLERECLALVREVSELTGDDPVEVIAQASGYKGAATTKINPMTMSDDRLANTVRDLRADVVDLRKKKAAPHDATK